MTATLTPDTATAFDPDDADLAGADTTAGAGVQYPYIARDVDPRELRLEGNIRDVTDIRESRPGLVESVATHGLNPRISMISVAPDEDGTLAVKVGFHRAAAAVAVCELEDPQLRIPVLVHAPGTQRDTLIAQGVENIHRQDLTRGEQIGLYQQLALQGLDDAQIAESLALPDPEQVRAGRAVAASPRTAECADLPEVDLFTLEQLAEFEDDPDLHETLVDALRNKSGMRFQWELADARRERQRTRLQAAEETRWRDAGYTVTDDDDEFDAPALALSKLCASQSDPTPLTTDTHAQCPGRAVALYVHSDGDVNADEYCLDPTEHAHHHRREVMTAAKAATLTERGVRVLDAESTEGTRLHDLYASQDNQVLLDPAAHAHCPGHAAHLDILPHSEEPVVRYVCTDPDAHGHIRTSNALRATTAKAPTDTKAELRRTKHNNRAWKEAKIARREWLTAFFDGWRTAGRPTTTRTKRTSTSTAKTSSKTTAKSRTKTTESAAVVKQTCLKLPARIQHWLALAPITAAAHLADAGHKHRYACALLGLGEPSNHLPESNPIVALLQKKTTTEAQATIIRLAQVLGAGEGHWDAAFTDNANSSWRDPSRDARFYFQLLQALGYRLSTVEKLIIDPAADAQDWEHLATQPTAEPSSTGDADDTPTSDQDTAAAVTQSFTEDDGADGELDGDAEGDDPDNDD